MARMFGCLLLLCLLLGASATRAADVLPPATGGATATLAQAIAALPAGWTVTYGAASEETDGTLTLKDVVVSHDGTLFLAAAGVTIAGLHGDGSADSPFAADRVTAQSLSDSAASGGGAADTLVASGVSVGPGAAEGLPPGSQAAAIVLALTAVRVDHAELSHLHVKDGTIGQLTLDHLAQGHVGGAALHDASFLDTGDQHMTMASIEADEVDVARLVRVFEPTAYAPAADGTTPTRLAIGPALGRFAVHGFGVTQNGAATGVGAIELTDLRLGQAPEAPRGNAAWTVPAAFGAAVIGDVTHHSASPSEPSFQLASAALTNYHDAMFDALQFGEMTFEQANEHTTFGLKSATIRGVDASGVAVWAANKARGGPAGEAPSPPPPHLGFFEFAGLFVDTPNTGRITVDAVRDELAYVGETPISQALSIRRLMVPTAVLARSLSAEVLAAFGRDSVTTDLDFKLVWDPQTHLLTLTPFQVAADELGTLTLKVTLGNVDLSLLPKGAEAALAGLIVATVNGGELVYADHSLIDRVLAGYAAMTGQTPQQLRQMLVAQLTKMKSPLPSRPQLPATLAAFLQHPGTLTVRISPATPLAAASVAALPPDEIAKQLGLQVTAQ